LFYAELHQHDSDTDNDTDDITGTNITQWTNGANCRPTVPVVRKFTDGPLCYDKQSHPTSIKALPHLAF